MKATLESMDLEYEACFSAPLFNLPTRSIEVLQALHEAVSPLTEPRSSDMQVVGGIRLSDVRISLNLFNGEGWLNLTTDSLVMRFNRLRHSDHFRDCKACIAASEGALKASLPDLTVRSATIKSTLSLRLDATDSDAGLHLAEVSGNDPQVDLGGLRNARVQRAIALDIENDEERWEAIFDAYRIKRDKAAMTATCRVWHFEGGALQDLDSRSIHLQYVLKALLEGIGLEVSGRIWEAPRERPSP